MYYTVFFSKGALSFMSTLNHLLQKLSAFHINAGILLLIYFLAINLISFQTMRLDKKRHAAANGGRPSRSCSCRPSSAAASGAFSP